MRVLYVFFENERHVFMHPFGKPLIFKRLQFYKTFFYRRLDIKEMEKYDGYILIVINQIRGGHNDI